VFGDRTILAAAAALVLAFGAGSARAETPHIRQLDIVLRGNEVLLDFTLSGVIDPALSRRLESGLETSINYTLRLEERNRYWFDQFLDEHRLRVTAAYDAVRREFVVRDTWDGKPSGSVTTREFDEAARRLLSRRELPAFRVRKQWPHKHLYVKMRGTYDAGNTFVLAPVDSSTDWKKSKTFKIHEADLR
jgi:hypothetical protein